MCHMLASLLLIMVVQLQNPAARGLRKGADLYRECKALIRLTDGNEHEDDGMYGIHCLGYIEGLSDGLTLSARKVCIRNVTNEAKVRTYVSFMEKNSRYMEYDQLTTVLAAMADAYPCPIN